jgi:uncharacterized protein
LNIIQKLKFIKNFSSIKYIFIIIFLFLQVNFLYSKTNGFVIDEANVINSEIKNNINSISTNIEEKTSAEIAVVTVNSLEGETIENFALKVFEKYKIGKSDKDNGVLILLSKEDRQLRIEVGYGLEGVLNDRKAGEIIRNTMIPYFKSGDFSEGTFQGFLEVADIVAKNYNLKLEDFTNIKRKEQKKSSNDFGEAILIIIGIFFFIFVLPRGGFFFFGGPRGGSGGSGFGGFGGFGGGGRSGGGGASGRW